jgi:hypothetical protein
MCCGICCFRESTESGHGIQWKIRSILEKSKSSRPNMTTERLNAVKSLRLNEDIMILQAENGHCMVVLDESKYKDKFLTRYWSPRFMNPCQKIVQVRLRGKYRNSLPQQTSASIWPSQVSQTRHSSEDHSEFFWFLLLCPGWFSP